MVPSGSLEEVTLAVSTWGHQLRRKKIRVQELCGLCVHPGVLLCEWPQKILFLCNTHPCFQGSSSHPGIFPNVSFDVYLLSTCWEGNQNVFLAQKKRKVHRVCSPSSNPSTSSHSQRGLISVFQSKVRAHSKLHMSGKSPCGARRTEKHHLTSLKAISPNVAGMVG